MNSGLKIIGIALAVAPSLYGMDDSLFHETTKEERMLSLAQVDSWRDAQELLKEGANPNARDKNGRSIVSYLLKNVDWHGVSEIIDECLQKGACIQRADVMQKDDSGNWVPIFVCKDDDYGWRNRHGITLLHQAVRHYPTCVEQIIEAGLDPNTPDTHGMTPLRYAINTVHERANRGGFLSPGTSENRHAREQPIIGSIRELAKKGANFNALFKQEYSADEHILICAIRAGVTPELFQLLVEYGADPQQCDDIMRSALESGWSMADCYVRTLLGCGIKPDPQCAIIAAENASIETIELLVYHGNLDLNACHIKNWKKRTALSIAAGLGNTKRMKKLLSLGAKPDDGVSLACAAEGHREDNVGLLFAAGASAHTPVSAHECEYSGKLRADGCKISDLITTLATKEKNKDYGSDQWVYTLALLKAHEHGERLYHRCPEMDARRHECLQKAGGKMPACTWQELRSYREELDEKLFTGADEQRITMRKNQLKEIKEALDLIQEENITHIEHDERCLRARWLIEKLDDPQLLYVRGPFRDSIAYEIATSFPQLFDTVLKKAQESNDRRGLFLGINVNDKSVLNGLIKESFNHPSLIESLIKLHPDGWEPGWYTWSCAQGKPEIVALLAKYFDVNKYSHSGKTPLLNHLEYDFGQKDNKDLKQWLDVGADPNKADIEHGYTTPLHCGVRKRNAQAIKLLLKKGANQFAQNDFGESPRSMNDKFLHYCYSPKEKNMAIKIDQLMRKYESKTMSRTSAK